MWKRIIPWLAASLTIAGVAPDTARAGLPPVQQATESMMNSEGLILTLVARDLGVEPSASLTFASAVDPVAETFSYTLQSGSTYLGQPMALSVSGAFDTPSQSWTWTSSGHIGATGLGGNGSTTFSGDPMSFDIFVPLDFNETIVSNVTYENTAIRTVSTGTITVKDSLTGGVISSGTHTDNLILSGPDKGKWQWDTGLITAANGAFALHAAGNSPVPDGGPGAFTVNIVPVPEPATVTLALTGATLTGLGHLLRRRVTA